MARITNEGILNEVAERAGVSADTAAEVFGLAVEAIQEQQQIIEQKDQQIRELEERLERIEAAIGIEE